jgi:hypothetical protein
MRLTPNHKLAILCTLIAIPTAVMAWKKLSAKDAERGGSLLEQLDDDHDAADALRAYARDQAALKAAHARDDVRAKQRMPALDELFDGSVPGKPGPRFDGLQLDQPWTASAYLTARLDALHVDTGAKVTILPDEITVFVPPAPDGGVDDVLTAARAAWGPGDGDRWLDEIDHVRASIRSSADGTHVAFQRAITAADLFPPDPSVPSLLYPAVGEDAAAVLLPLDAHANPTSTGSYYVLPGIGWSNNPVHVDVDLANDLVTAVHIRTGAVADADIEVVNAALRARYGEPRADGTWRDGKAAITAKVRVPDGLVVDLTRSR